MELPILEDRAVRIRPLKRSDAPAIAKGIGLRAVSRWLPMVPYPYALGDAQTWINYAHRTARKDLECHFGIERLDRDGIIGGIGLRNLNRQDQNAEVGYWIAKPQWGLGLGSEAVALTLRFAFGALKLHRVYAIVLEANVGSARVLEKNGFVREGTWRKASRWGRRWRDVWAYGILREEWRPGDRD